MTIARTYQTATLLPSGEVLEVGGVGPERQSLKSAELYDPSTGTWSRTGPMAVARYGQTATLLLDGTVLVAGGFDSRTKSSISSAGLYHPDTGQWTSVGSMTRLGAVTPPPCSAAARCSSPADSTAQGTTTCAGRGLRPVDTVVVLDRTWRSLVETIWRSSRPGTRSWWPGAAAIQRLIGDGPSCGRP